MEQLIFRNALASWPSVFAPVAGLLLLVVFSLMRAAGQPFVDHIPIVAAIWTLLVFLVPGAVAGIVAPRSFFWNGAVLGTAAAAFVTLQANQFQQPDWSSISLYKTFALFICVSVPLCVVGALGGHFVNWRWQSSPPV